MDRSAILRSEGPRRALVDRMARSGTLRSPSLRAAFLAVPREIFVPELAAAHGITWVYADEALVTRVRDGIPTSSSSQPTIMALMLEALDARRGARVLEIGLGTGYNAAIIRCLVGSEGAVTSIDIDPNIVAGARRALDATGYAVNTAVGDGSLGCPAEAPYDRIIVTASTDHLPYPWWQQLAPDGVLVAPVRCGGMPMVPVFARTPTGFTSTAIMSGGFMPIRSDPDAAGGPDSPDDDLGPAFSKKLSDWYASGASQSERLAVAYDYEPLPQPPPWTITTWYAYGQRRCLGWRSG